MCTEVTGSSHLASQRLWHISFVGPPTQANVEAMENSLQLKAYKIKEKKNLKTPKSWSL